MDRRTFGQRVLQLSAALGLRSVSARGLGALGMALGACDDPGRGPASLGSDGGGGGTAPTDGAIDGGAGSAGAMEGGRDAGLDAQREADAHEQIEAAAGTKSKSVIIIGSGYGSAVTALRLTERGIPVTILEKGRLWNTKQKDGTVFCDAVNPDGRAMWFKPRIETVVKKFFGLVDVNFETAVQAGVIDVSGPPSMRVYRGVGVGGGSLVNLAVFVTPERDVLQRALPDVDVDAMLQTFYPRAKTTLRTTRVPESLIQTDVYQYARVGAQAAKDAGYAVSTVESGYDYAYLQKEVDGTAPKSAAAGKGGFGNDYGKNSLDKTYLADAMGTGLLTILSLHEVKRVRKGEAGGFVLDVNSIDIDGKVLKQVELPCTHLFVGAGSMGSTELLVRARERGDLPDLSSDFGTFWGPNSDIFVARDNPVWTPTGATQCTVPATTFTTRDQLGKQFFSMIIPMPVGIETYVSFNIVMVDNVPVPGHFTYDAAKDSVDLQWDREQSAPAVASSKYVFDAINTKASSSYSQGDLFGGPTICDNATYHPVGGCPLGKATDAYGRVPQYPGLYVVDSSLIRVGLCANPALTTAALAERNVERVLAEDFKV